MNNHKNSNISNFVIDNQLRWHFTNSSNKHYFICQKFITEKNLPICNRYFQYCLFNLNIHKKRGFCKLNRFGDKCEWRKFDIILYLIKGNNYQYTFILACEGDFYGKDCQFKCGHCKNKVCNFVNGECLFGECDPFWIGKNCHIHLSNITMDRFTAATITTSTTTNTTNITTTSTTTTATTAISSSSTTPVSATENVKNATEFYGQLDKRVNGELKALTSDCLYGIGCKSPCGRCKFEKCDESTGECQGNECETGWFGKRCDNQSLSSPEIITFETSTENEADKLCFNGHFYGSECNIPCGRCRYGVSCDSATGHCPKGLCELNWTGKKCDELIHSESCLTGF